MENGEAHDKDGQVVKNK